MLLLLFLFKLVEFRCEQLHGKGLVLVLRAFVLFTTIPVGRWVILTAESVLFTLPAVA